jgi:hypothetical protein
MAVAAILAFAAVAKARHLGVFAEQIADYRIVPYRTRTVSAVGVTGIEAVTAGLIIVPPTRVSGALLAATLLGLFSAVLAHTVHSGRRIGCACFGSSDAADPVGHHSVVRTVLLMTLAMLAAFPGQFRLTAAALVCSATLAVAVFLISEVVRLYATLRPVSDDLARSMISYLEQTQSTARSSS